MHLLYKLFYLILIIFILIYAILLTPVHSTGGSEGIKLADILKDLSSGQAPGVYGNLGNVSFNTNHPSKERRHLLLASTSGTNGNGSNENSGFESQITPSKNEKKPNKHVERAAIKAAKTRERAERALHIKEMTEGRISRFQAKHLFKNGVLGQNSNSFEYFSTSPENAKDYLIDLNLKLYKGAVLPGKGRNQFNKWLNDKLGERFLTILNQHNNVLQADIKPKFEKWKHDELEKNGVLPTIFPNFETTLKQIFTHLSFLAIRDKNNRVLRVNVKASEYYTHVILGTDGEGNLSHLEGIIIDNVEPLREKIVTTFSVSELEKIAELSDEFWKKLGVPTNKKGINLNEEGASYQEAKKIFDYRRAVVNLEMWAGLLMGYVMILAKQLMASEGGKTEIRPCL